MSNQRVQYLEMSEYREQGVIPTYCPSCTNYVADCDCTSIVNQRRRRQFIRKRAPLVTITHAMYQ